MTINYTDEQRQLVQDKLVEAGLATDRVNDVLYNVTAAFTQQFNNEVDYMVNEGLV